MIEEKELPIEQEPIPELPKTISLQTLLNKGEDIALVVEQDGKEGRLEYSHLNKTKLLSEFGKTQWKFDHDIPNGPKIYRSVDNVDSFEFEEWRDSRTGIVDPAMWRVSPRGYKIAQTEDISLKTPIRSSNCQCCDDCEDVLVFVRDVLSCGVCALKKLSLQTIVEQVNICNPAEEHYRWIISTDKHFSEGETNIEICPMEGLRAHWTFVLEEIS